MTEPDPSSHEHPDLTRDQFTNDRSYWLATGDPAYHPLGANSPQAIQISHPVDLDDPVLFAQIVEYAGAWQAEDAEWFGPRWMLALAAKVVETRATERQREEARRERDELAAAMKRAPHAGTCQGWRPSRILWVGPCTCWKSAASSEALAEVKREAAASALKGEGRVRLGDALAVSGIVVNDAALDRIVSAWEEFMGESCP